MNNLYAIEIKHIQRRYRYFLKRKKNYGKWIYYTGYGKGEIAHMNYRTVKFIGCPYCGGEHEPFRGTTVCMVAGLTTEVCVSCGRKSRIMDYYTRPFVVNWKSI